MKTNQILLFSSSRFAQGNPRLGEKLMLSFLESVEKSEILPDALIFTNSAVSLLCQDSPMLEVLGKIEKKGVKILADEESMMFYALKQCMGDLISMDTMASVLLEADRVVTL